MAITLGGIALPDGTGNRGIVDWIDKNKHSNVTQATKVTVGGKFHVRPHGLDGGRPITLEADVKFCWLEASIKDSLQAASEVSGAEYDLDWNGTIYKVVFRHHEPPALDLEPFTKNADLYIGQIKLTEIAS